MPSETMTRERGLSNRTAILGLCSGIFILLFVAGFALRSALQWSHNFPAWFETTGRYSMLTNYGPVEPSGPFFGGDHTGSATSFWCVATPDGPARMQTQLQTMMRRDGLLVRNGSSHRNPDLVELKQLAARASWSFPGREQQLATARYFSAQSQDGKDYWIVFIYPSETTTRAEIACLTY
jgi:hypothetical protein